MLKNSSNSLSLLSQTRIQPYVPHSTSREIVTLIKKAVKTRMREVEADEDIFW